MPLICLIWYLNEYILREIFRAVIMKCWFHFITLFYHQNQFSFLGNFQIDILRISEISSKWHIIFFHFITMVIGYRKYCFFFLYLLYKIIGSRMFDSYFIFTGANKETHHEEWLIIFLIYWVLQMLLSLGSASLCSSETRSNSNASILSFFKNFEFVISVATSIVI